MTSEEDMLIRPILNGMCMYESLKNGTLDLLDITKMNEALDVQSANQNIIRNSK